MKKMFLFYEAAGLVKDASTLVVVGTNIMLYANVHQNF